MVLSTRSHFQQYFSYIMETSFSGGRSRSTRGEPPIMGKQLVNLSLVAASRVHHLEIRSIGDAYNENGLSKNIL